MAKINKVLSDSNTYGATKRWVLANGASPLTTKGDVYTFSTTNARLGVGTNGYVLTADSSEATGLKWAASTSANYFLDGLTFGTDSKITGSMDGTSNVTGNAMTTFTPATTFVAEATFDTGIVVGGTATAAGYIKINPDTDDSGDFPTTLKVGVNTEAQTYTLPLAYPASSGYALVSTDAGVMSWAVNQDGNYYVTGGTYSAGAIAFSGTTSFPTFSVTGIPTGTIGGSLTDNYIPIGTAANTIGDFILGLTENDSIYLGSNPEATTNTAQNNTALGISALNDITTGDNNVAIGIQAGQKTTTQERNTIMGVSALRYASGSASYNVAIGYATMGASDQEGSQNTAVGYYALSGATGANAVTAVGHLAARDLTTGDSHVAIGKSAMLKVTTSSYNTVVGVDALSDVAGAGSTTAVGFGAMKYSSADNATGIGQYALSGATGDKNAALGNSAGAIAKGSANSVMVGYQAGYHPTGNSNIWVGYKAGYGVVDSGAQNNVGIGNEAMLNVTTGKENVAVGDQAGYGITTANYSVGIGTDALRGVTTGAGNIGIGRYAGASLATDQYTIAIGSSAAQDATTSESVLIGQNSGYSLTGDQNIAIGKSSLYAGTSANKNVAIGHQALTAATTAHSSVAIGYQALDSTTLGSENVAIGAYAGQSYVGTTSSVYGGLSVFLGHTAGYQMTGNASYGSVCVLGHAAGYSATGANLITAVGNSAMYYADGALNTTAVGRVAGAYDEGTGSVWVGDSAGYRISGNYNVSIGYEALSGASSGTGYGTAEKNVAIGRQSLAGVTSGRINVAVGYNAGKSMTTGYSNVSLGNEAGYSLTTARKNVAVGNQAGYSMSTGTGSVMVGETAGVYSTNDYAIGIGYNALGGNTSGDGNIAIGKEALKVNTTGNYNTAIGYEALETNVHGDRHTAVGYQALKNLATADNDGYDTAVGYMAGRSTTTGRYNVYMGTEAGYTNTSGDQNVYIGYAAGYTDDGSDENVMIGSQAGYDNAAGGYNVFIGAKAAVNATAVDSSVIIGRQAASAAAATGDDNVIMGYRAAYDLTSGYSLVAIGYEAGANVTTANRNIYIGYQAGHAQVASAEYSVMIGELAGYDVSGQRNLMIGGGAGVNAAVATTETTFIGYNAGANASGTSNTFVGSSAGASTNAGNELTAVGKGSLSTVTGSYNTAIGFGVMADGAGSGGYNTGVGQRALQAITNGGYNTAVGVRAGAALTTQNANTLIGTEAGSKITASNNTVVGMFSAQKLAGGSGHNVIIGDYAGRGDSDLFSGSYNTVVGSYAASKNTLKDFSENTVIGHRAASGATSMSANVVIGEKAAMNASTASYSTIIGHEAGYEVTTGTENTFVGYNSGRATTTSNYNVALGNGALETATGVDNSVAIGRQAMGAAAADGDNNVAVGYQAFYDATTGNGNVFMGAGAGKGGTTSQKNVVIGNNAGHVLGTHNGSVFIGFEAARLMSGGSGGSVAIGHQALYSGTQNYQDTAIGINAGKKATGGSANNVFLGSHAGPSSVGAISNKLYINNAEGTPLIGGDFSTPSLAFNADDVTISSTGTIKTTNNILTIQETAGSGAADNEDTGAAILFKGYNHDASTPTSVGLGRILTTHVNDMTTTAGTQDGIMEFQTAINGTLTGQMSIGYDGNGQSLNLFGIGVSGSGTPQINYPDVANAYLYFGSDGSYTSGSSYKPAGISTDGNPDPNDSGGDQQLHIFAQDDLSLAAGNYGKNGANRIVFRAIETAASNPTERMTILGGGNVGIGTSAPAGKLEIIGDSGTVVATPETDAEELVIRNNHRAGISILSSESASRGGYIVFGGATDNNAANIQHNFDAKTFSFQGQNTDMALRFASANNVEAMRIDKSQNVGIGTTTPEGVLHTANNSGVNIFQRSNDSASYGTNMYVRKSRGTVGSESNTQDGDMIGQIAFSPYYGDYDNYAASISAKVTGTLAADTTPGYLAFSTAAAGANTVSQRMCIDAAGKVGINTTAPTAELDVRGSSSAGMAAFVSGTGNGTYPVMHVIDSADTEVAWFEGNRAGDTGAYIGVRHWPASATENARSGIKFQSKDDGGALTNYATLLMRVDDYTGGTEDGNLRVEVMKNGTSTEMAKFDTSGLTVTGTLSATAKSFNIPHPLYKDKRLVHGSLEGPEHGIYIRGTIEASKGCEIELPEYWEAMCEDYTVQLTPHGPYTVFIKEKQKGKVMVDSTSKIGHYKFDYYVVGSRTDETLEVVQDA